MISLTAISLALFLGWTLQKTWSIARSVIAKDSASDVEHAAAR
jgi:hypothetical protein